MFIYYLKFSASLLFLKLCTSDGGDLILRIFNCTALDLGAIKKK